MGAAPLTVCAAEGLPNRVAAFRPADVYRFMKTITDSGVSLGTRHRRFRETRAFFSWCTRMGSILGGLHHQHFWDAA